MKPLMDDAEDFVAVNLAVLVELGKCVPSVVQMLKQVTESARACSYHLSTVARISNMLILAVSVVAIGFWLPKFGCLQCILGVSYTL